MRIGTVEVFNFRNLQNQIVDLPTGVTLCVGKNGQGKTSFLEALFILAYAKSFRSSKSAELIRWRESMKVAPGLPRLDADGSQCSVAAKIYTSLGDKHLRWTLESGKRQVFLNQKKIGKASQFYGQVAAVLFTPDELQLIKGAPTLRRSFLDRIHAMIDPVYVDHLVSYQRSLRQRNALLLSFAKGARPVDQTALESWNQLLISHGLIIARKRLELMQMLAGDITRYYHCIAGIEDQKATVEVRYLSDFVTGTELVSAEEAVTLFHSQTTKDVQARATTLGIQRDDFLILLDTGFGLKQARKSASQGQARSLALALKLAAISRLEQVLGEPPVLLLDDVESELDSSRKEALYALLASTRSQIVITATEESAAFSRHFGSAARLNFSAGTIT